MHINLIIDFENIWQPSPTAFHHSCNCKCSQLGKPYPCKRHFNRDALKHISHSFFPSPIGNRGKVLDSIGALMTIFGVNSMKASIEINHYH